MESNFRYPTFEQALDLHEDAINLFGGRFPVNDYTMLHSALERPKVTFAGRDLYPDIFTKAAALIESLVLNHPFDDGNKRTALLVTALFFNLNHYELLTERFSSEMYTFMKSIDLKQSRFPEIVSWFKTHVRKMKRK